MPVVPFEKTSAAPEDTTWAWNADTGNALLGSDGDDWATYKRAHTWFDDADGSVPEKKADYKLPHHAMIDGKLSVVWRGVSNAMARLKQSDLPESDMKGAFDHLAAHYPQWGKTPPDWERFLTEVQVRQQLRRSAREHTLRLLAQSRFSSQGQQARQPSGGRSGPPLGALGVSNRFPVMTTRADIISGGLGAVADGTAALPSGTPTEEMLALINLRTRTPQKASDLYVFPTQISNQNLDSFWTRMTPRSLTWFAEDATRGVAICDSHVHGRLPIGRSFYGTVDSQVEDGPSGHLATMTTQTLGYLVRGMQLSNGMASDDVARGIEAGLYWQASIGFDPVAFTCSVCGRNMLTDFDCYHIPGFLYPAPEGRVVEGSLTAPSLPVANYGEDDGDGWMPPVGMCGSPEEALYPPSGMVACIADVDAHLIEYSLVFRHATPDAEVPSGPNAMLLKAEAEAERGRANPRLLMAVEDRCHVRLFDRWSGFGPGLSGIAGSHNTSSSAPTFAPPEEEDEMRGSEYIYVGARDYFARAGKELSAQNLSELRDMATRLQAGHDTMREGIGMLNAWLIEKDGTGAGKDSNADLVAANAGTAENAAAMQESTASSQDGANGQQTIDAIAAAGGDAGNRAQVSRAGEGRAESDDAQKPKVSPEDQAVDKAIDAVEAALKGLQIAQKEDEQSEGDTISPEDKAVDAAIKAAFDAINKVKAAQEKDEASDPKGTDDRAYQPAATAADPTRAARAQKASDEAGDEDAQDSTDEDEGSLPVDPDDPDSEEDPDEQNAKNNARADLDFDSHKAFTGKHQHGKFDMHAHDGDADHSNAPLKDANAADDGDEGGEDERVDTGVDPAHPDAHDMGGDPTRARAALSARSGGGQQRAVPATLSRADREALEYGRQMRARLVDEALAEGVRAFGPGFNPETYRAILTNSTAAQVQALKDDWNRAAALALSPIGTFTPDASAPGGGYWDATPAGNGVGGRQTVARDPSDPVGVSAAGARPQRGGRGLPGPVRSDPPLSAVVRPRDISLFQVGSTPASGRSSGGAANRNGRRHGGRRR